MIISKVIRKHRRHITRADYGDNIPLLDSENVLFPKIGSTKAAALRRLLPLFAKMSHREFDKFTKSYRLSEIINQLRHHGWTIVNHPEEIAIRDGVAPRRVKFTRYELYAVFTDELLDRIVEFCDAVDEFEQREAK
jgi:hypothetical protein